MNLLHYCISYNLVTNNAHNMFLMENVISVHSLYITFTGCHVNQKHHIIFLYEYNIDDGWKHFEDCIGM